LETLQLSLPPIGQRLGRATIGSKNSYDHQLLGRLERHIIGRIDLATRVTGQLVTISRDGGKGAERHIIGRIDLETRVTGQLTVCATISRDGGKGVERLIIGRIGLATRVTGQLVLRSRWRRRRQRRRRAKYRTVV
jgi:hypothetical protein